MNNIKFPTQSGELNEERALCQALLSLQESEGVWNFLLDLCTPAELQAMVDRWRVVILLNEGKSYRQIQQMTGISLTTIGRVARFVAQGNGGYTLALANKEELTELEEA